MRGRLWILGCLLLVGFGFVVGIGFGRDEAGPGAPAGDGGPAGEPGAPGAEAVSAEVAPAAVLAPAVGSVPETLGPEERRDVEVFRSASGSVVFITSIALRRDLWSFDVLQLPQGTGSGFVWDRRGHIVTNFHVVESGDKFSVTLADQSEWPAEIVGIAPEKDLAVLRIEAPAERLSPLTLGSSRDLLVGQKVLALGNPFGLDHSMTSGIVSAVGRELRAPGGRLIRDVIQTDAAINPGNSGGPLLDSTGRVVGVNAAIFSPSGASAGVGFAVPVDIVKRYVPQLVQRGRAVRPDIAASYLTDAQAERFGLEGAGAVVRNVVAGGPADRAGIEGIARTRRGYVLGDVIVAVDGKPVRSGEDLAYSFETAGVGRKVALTVRRGDEDREVEVTLEDAE